MLKHPCSVVDLLKSWDAGDEATSVKGSQEDSGIWSDVLGCDGTGFDDGTQPWRAVTFLPAFPSLNLLRGNDICMDLDNQFWFLPKVYHIICIFKYFWYLQRVKCCRDVNIQCLSKLYDFLSPIVDIFLFFCPWPLPKFWTISTESKHFHYQKTDGALESPILNLAVQWWEPAVVFIMFSDFKPNCTFSRKCRLSFWKVDCAI